VRREGCGSRRTLFHLTRTRLRAGLRVSHGWASVRPTDMAGRYSSEIRTGCANQRPSGSVRGAASDGCPYRDRQLSQRSGCRGLSGQENDSSWGFCMQITASARAPVLSRNFGKDKARAFTPQSSSTSVNTSTFRQTPGPLQEITALPDTPAKDAVTVPAVDAGPPDT
jgi:hypothetical protein